LQLKSSFFVLEGLQQDEVLIVAVIHGKRILQ